MSAPECSRCGKSLPRFVALADSRRPAEIFCSPVCVALAVHGEPTHVKRGGGPVVYARGTIHSMRVSGRIVVEERPNLWVLRAALNVLMPALWCAAREAYPFWRSDPEVIAAVEAVADHRIGGRISQGRLGRAYVRAWRSDHGGYRTAWMKRALDARAWRKR